ncbi:MAG: carbohydrate-binding family 9-like protein [Candidatus Aenigmatarchaeota archaeon]
MRVNKTLIILLLFKIILFSSDFITLRWDNIKNIKELPKTIDFKIPYIKIEDEKNLTNEIINKGCKIEDFKVYPTGQNPKFKTKAFICYDDENLLIYFESEKSENYFLKGRRFEKEEGKIWNDDNFEIFIDPFYTKKRYYHIIINSIGEIYDTINYIEEIPDPKAADPKETKKSFIIDMSWNSKVKCDITVEKNYWSITLKIPFSSFGFTKVPTGSFIGINLCRNYWETNELLQWKLTPGEGGFHQPDKFGILKIQEIDNKNLPQISINNFLPGYGENLLFISYKKNYDTPEEVNVEISIENVDTKEKIIKNEKVVFTDRKNTIQIPFENKWKGQTIFYYLISSKNYAFGDIDFVNLKNLMDIKLDNLFLYPEEKGLNGKIRIYLGEMELRKSELLFKLNDKNKTEKIKGNLCEFFIDTKNLKEGENRFSIVLYRDKNKIEEFEFKIFKLSKMF